MLFVFYRVFNPLHLYHARRSPDVFGMIASSPVDSEDVSPGPFSATQAACAHRIAANVVSVVVPVQVR